MPLDPSHYRGAWFNQQFIDTKVPYMSVSFNEARIDQGGAILSHATKNALAQYSAKWCHVVAHSAGGLWTRKLLELNFANLGNPDFGVRPFEAVGHL